ncbi:MAG: prepilin-type N-terminal cleavage/methylation domain-containing protein [bacterium]|jgi:prepilin-type N-terminal cleavage/methylation domain-containing protein|nr:prepilin-type N-terminal cleavage/methylation domain-containing protein [bacterium]
MNPRAFTLVELLIVVAIIGILAAIAVPNYRDALTRTRISQVKVELHNLGFALQNYRMDHNFFPRKRSNLEFFAVYLFPELTSPIPYLGSAKVRDPFGPVIEYEERNLAMGDANEKNSIAGLIRNSYTYTPYANFAELQGNPILFHEGYLVSSIGPDQMDSYIVDYPFPKFYRWGPNVNDSVYNPSNGIYSIGDIGFFGGDLPRQGLVGG